MVQRESTKGMQEAYDLMGIDDEDFTPYCATRGGHAPEAGMMVVHPEDLDTVAQARGKVECGDCDMVYRVGKGWS